MKWGEGEQHNPQGRDPHRIVTVIGAGIAGLSAAHELVERGFIVQVVEPRESLFDEHECEVGGLAASQYSRTPTTHTCHPELFDPDQMDVPEWYQWDEAPAGVERQKGWRPFRERLPDDEKRAVNLRLIGAIRAKTMRSTQPKLPFVERIVFARTSKTVELDEDDDAKSKNGPKLTAVCVKILRALWLYYNDLTICLGADCRPADLDPEVRVREVFLLEIRGRCGTGADAELNTLAWQRAEAVKEKIIAMLAHIIGSTTAPPTNEDSNDARSAIDDKRYYSHVDLSEAVKAYWSVLDELHYTGEAAEQIGKHLIVRIVQSRARPPTVEKEVKAFHYVDFHCVEHVPPGEHGYRYFPSFYHNLFDTMQRTPVIDDDGRATFETVYERLIHPPTVSLATKNKGLVRSPKQMPPSLEEGKSRMRTILEDLNVTSKDLQLATNRLLKMATSCQARTESVRKMSWLSFVNGDSERNPPDPQTMAEAGPGPYSPNGAQVLRTLPQSLIAMRAEESDARTYGIAAIQNIRDYQAEQLTHTDRMLNGPTSEVWLRHWKRYLKSQNVHFFVGHVDKLVFRNGAARSDHRRTDGRRSKVGVAIRPIYGPKRELDPEQAGVDSVPDPDTDTDPTDYYVLADPARSCRKAGR